MSVIDNNTAHKLYVNNSDNHIVVNPVSNLVLRSHYNNMRLVYVVYHDDNKIDHDKVGVITGIIGYMKNQPSLRVIWVNFCFLLVIGFGIFLYAFVLDSKYVFPTQKANCFLQRASFEK